MPAIPATERASSQAAPSTSVSGATSLLATWTATMANDALTPQAVQWSKHALLDWLAITIAARDEPLVRMLVEEYAMPGDAPCSIIGVGKRARMHDAALINGAAGHALDFDDVNPRMGGHPTVPVAPVVLALGEATGASGLDVLRAFAVGYEVECQVGDMGARSHYLHGFHATGTIGTFGAAAAAANILGLDASECAHALGMAAAQAAGLKSMFGTMTKPLHAGKAAMNGLMAAQLAARGFTANQAGIECAQGFGATQVPQFVPLMTPVDVSKGFAVQSNLFKYHAACYLTHSAIEAIRMIRNAHGIGLDDMQSIGIGVLDSHKKVCDIREPETGLNIKFSIRQLACMALDGCDTADLAMYSEKNAQDPRYVQARKRVQLIPTETEHIRAASVTITTKDQRILQQDFNVANPAVDAQAQWQRLTAKARAIVAPIIGSARCDELISAVDSLESATSLESLLSAAS